jgi:hypothetical protein
MNRSWTENENRFWLRTSQVCLQPPRLVYNHMGDRDPLPHNGRARERNDVLEQQRSALEYFYWLGDTFSNKERARSLLQPEVDNNHISQYDFEKAVEYLPRMKADARRNVRALFFLSSLLPDEHEGTLQHRDRQRARPHDLQTIPEAYRSHSIHIRRLCWHVLRVQ